MLVRKCLIQLSAATTKSAASALLETPPTRAIVERPAITVWRPLRSMLPFALLRVHIQGCQNMCCSSCHGLAVSCRRAALVVVETFAETSSLGLYNQFVLKGIASIFNRDETLRIAISSNARFSKKWLIKQQAQEMTGVQTNTRVQSADTIPKLRVQRQSTPSLRLETQRQLRGSSVSGANRPLQFP